MTWLSWIVIAFIFMGSELFVPTGFVLLIVGLAFFVTGLAVAAGLSEPTWLPWAVCLGSLLAFMSLLRKPLIRFFGFDSSSTYNELVGTEIVIGAEIPAGKVGHGELRGTRWNVRNVGTTTISSGERLKVLRMDELTVEVSK